MKKIYSKIWMLAKQYYQKGRPMDIDHINWMMHDDMSKLLGKKIYEDGHRRLAILGSQQNWEAAQVNSPVSDISRGRAKI